MFSFGGTASKWYLGFFFSPILRSREERWLKHLKQRMKELFLASSRQPSLNVSVRMVSSSKFMLTWALAKCEELDKPCRRMQNVLQVGWLTNRWFYLENKNHYSQKVLKILKFAVNLESRVYLSNRMGKNHRAQWILALENLKLGPSLPENCIGHLVRLHVKHQIQFWSLYFSKDILTLVIVQRVQ